MTRSTRTHKIKLIHKLKQTQKISIKLYRLLRSSVERTIRYFNTQTTFEICESITYVITLSSQINSLFKYVHTSFRYVKSDSTPVDTGRKLNVHKTFRRRPECSMYVQFTSCVYWDSWRNPSVYDRPSCGDAMSWNEQLLV